MKDKEYEEILEENGNMNKLSKIDKVKIKLFSYIPRNKKDIFSLNGMVALLALWVVMVIWVGDPVPFIDEIGLPFLIYWLSESYSKRNQPKSNKDEKTEE